MILYNESDYSYNIEALCREFLRGGELFVSKDRNFEETEESLTIVRTEDSCQITAKKGETEYTEKTEDGNPTSGELERKVYKVLSDLTGIRPKWGILTGVRPVKLALKQIELEGVKKAADTLADRYLLSDEKLKLLMETAEREQNILAVSEENSFSMYISVPFCPTRCSYCSFTSQAISQAKALIPQYVTLLCEELRETAVTAKELGLKLESVYMGGGTPTTLSAEQLDTVLKAVEEHFDMSTVREITVEAGRPDTITREKLETLKAHHVGRISINPQTMNDTVLKTIGRNHTAQDIKNCYETACEIGFDSINMDLISGLPGDDLESFKSTIKDVLAMEPDNITLHTLTMKHGSNLKPEQKKYLAQTVSDMNEYAYQKFMENGYHPYYLYRQKGSVENLENVGFCKDGKEGIYNVFIMDEAHTILSTGAGGVTKLRDPYSGHIERVANYKYPFEYCGNFDVIRERKEQIMKFYDKISLKKL